MEQDENLRKLFVRWMFLQVKSYLHPTSTIVIFRMKISIEATIPVSGETGNVASLSGMEKIIFFLRAQPGNEEFLQTNRVILC